MRRAENLDDLQDFASEVDNVVCIIRRMLLCDYRALEADFIPISSFRTASLNRPHVPDVDGQDFGHRAVSRQTRVADCQS